MSSTNRGGDRNAQDYYITPRPVIKTLLENLVDDGLIDVNTRLRWLDPCCGGDELNKASYPTVINEMFNNPNLCTVDIREDSHAILKGSFLEMDEKFNSPDIVISNPPFYLAIDFIKKSLEAVQPGGLVILLLRLNYIGSIGRFEFFKNNMPSYMYVHHKRMSFRPDGKTDSIEYAHFVWRKGNNPTFAQTKLI